MEELAVDVVIIGSGPAGQKAAIQAVKLGKKVLVIEQDNNPGGNCLYSGTIPSKTFREAVMALSRSYDKGFRPKEKQDELMAEVTISDLKQRIGKVVEDEKFMLITQFARNDIKVIKGTARFQSSQKIIVIDHENTITHQIEAKFFVIATGSRPRNPPEVPFDGKVIYDSTTLLNIENIPKSMIVLGGGVIGSEYASFFATLGTKVTVIDKREHMLPMLDGEIGVHLEIALGERGLEFIGNSEIVEISKKNDRAVVKLKDDRLFEAETLLYALGRIANIEELKLDNANVIADRGYIVVNELYQTNISNIYAVGDVIGGASLAATSMEQGRLAILHAFRESSPSFPELYPAGIYTIPEISCCGYTEDQLEKLNYHYEVGRAYYSELARGHISGETAGLLKILFHAETLEILGVHIVGRNATELVHLGQMAMDFRVKIDYFIDKVFNYPTFAEAYRIAALNGYNKMQLKKSKI